ncbi:MAG: YihY/virulence factor BrkB family protein [Clostridia bacterium]|nr:YihY/virulence factor BrkB family protein [Clostridia bacterium]
MKNNPVFRPFKLLSEKRLSTVAGAWVFYFLLSVIPLVFLVITAFGVFGVEISMDLVSRLPEEFRPAGEAIVSTATTASKGATLLFVVTAIFSCSRLLGQMSKDGDFIYGIKSKTKRGIMRRFWAIIALAALFMVFAGASVVVAFGSELFNFSFLVGGAKKLITTTALFFVAILISYIIIMLLNRFISPVKLKFKEVAGGGFVSLFIIVSGTIGFALYLRFFNSYNAFYGSLAGIVVFLLWTYILMVGLVAGVIINQYVYSKSAKNLTKKERESIIKTKVNVARG